MTGFRLLGDFAVEVDGAAVEVGHARQREVLTVLLLEVNRAVSLDQLADRVWGEQAPRHPQNALYSYVSRLRVALSPLSDVAIRRQGSGYVLEAEPTIIDVHRFGYLVKQACAAVDDRHALALFDEALGLWRGQPFVGMDSPWLSAMRENLEQQRWAAELDRNEVLLRTGQHAELVVALSTSSAAASLDERVAAQLMLALYRCGRQADALAHYQRLRERLGEELGADPSPPLQRLHQQILTADTDLDTPNPEPRRTHHVVPHQLPTPPPSFTGRVRELEALSEMLATESQGDSTAVISALGGGGGIGKTWLALRWAHDHRDAFPDGQLYVNLRGFDPEVDPVSPEVVVRGFLEALGASIPAERGAQEGKYRSLVADRRMLIVLDNARDSAQVVPLLPGGNSCAVLVTSRHRLDGLLATQGARPLALDFLTDIEARNLLGCHLGASRVTKEPEAVDELLRWCAGLPLALGIVAARAATQPDFPLTALVDELRHTSARLDALDLGELAGDLRAVFMASYRVLDIGTATLFRLLGLAPGAEFSVATAATFTDLPTSRTRALLRKLASAHLVEEHQPGRYRMHDLVGLYAAEQASAIDSEQDRRAALTRMFDHYRYAAAAAAATVFPDEPYRRPPIPEPAGPSVSFVGGKEALEWLDAERAMLLAIAAHAAAHGWPEHVSHLSTTLFRYLDVGAHYHDALTLHSSALAAVSGDHHAGLRNALGCRGFTLFRLGRYGEAIADNDAALHLAQVAGDKVGENAVSASLGIIYDTLGDHDAALAHFEHALLVAQSTGHPVSYATALNNIGDICRKLGRYDEALEYLERGIAVYRLGVLLNSLGDLYRELGRHSDSVDILGWALVLARGVRDRSLEVEVLISLGASAAAKGAAYDARGHYERALAIATEIEYPYALAGAHDGLARHHREVGNRAESCRHAGEAFAIYTDLNAPEADKVDELLRVWDRS